MLGSNPGGRGGRPLTLKVRWAKVSQFRVFISAPIGFSRVFYSFLWQMFSLTAHRFYREHLSYLDKTASSPQKRNYEDDVSCTHLRFSLVFFSQYMKVGKTASWEPKTWDQKCQRCPHPTTFRVVIFALMEANRQIHKIHAQKVSRTYVLDAKSHRAKIHWPHAFLCHFKMYISNLRKNS